MISKSTFIKQIKFFEIKKLNLLSPYYFWRFKNVEEGSNKGEFSYIGPFAKVTYITRLG